MKIFFVLNLCLFINLGLSHVSAHPKVSHHSEGTMSYDCCGNNEQGQDERNAEKEALVEESLVSPEKISGLLTFWDFQEPAGTSRVSKGRYEYALQEMNGPIKNVEDGIFGPYSADLEWGQWFRLKHKDAPGLDLHGQGRQLTMVAWVKRESDRVWQYIAGKWNEGDKNFLGKAGGTGEGAPSRQYALFLSGSSQSDYTTYKRTPAEHQTMGYVSPFGGATPDRPFAFDYATGKTRLEQDNWYMTAFTFDGKAIKVYVNGDLDENGNYNPFLYDGPIFSGGENGADFTVAQRNHYLWPAYPDGVPENKEGFDGRIGGLAVYDRALTSDEIRELYKSTMTK